MKKRLLYLLTIAVALVSLASIVGINTANAIEPSQDINRVRLKLTGTSDPSGYSVVGSHTVNGQRQNVSFNYEDDKQTWLSDGVPGANGQPCVAGQNNTAQKLQITVKQGTRVASSLLFDFCGKGFPFIFDASTRVSGQPQEPACFTGTLKYKSEDGGQEKPFRENATGTLKGGPDNKTYELKFNNQGKIDEIPDLPPGRYTVTANYIPSSPADGEFTRNITKTIQLIALPGGDCFALTEVAATAGTTPGSGGVTSQQDPGQLNCDLTFDNPLTWVLCPVVKVLVDMIERLDELITSQLTIESSDIFCSSGDTCNAYRDAWQDFRNIALGLLIIVGLLVLIAQALGMELLDAYTIRKVLPAFLIAVIGIVLSWPIMQFLVELINDLGHGVRYLIVKPFDSLGNDLNLSFGDGITELFFGTGAVVGGAAVGVPLWIAFGGIGSLLAWAGTIALAVLTAVVVLVARQVVIIMLMLIAPVAILAYILPNTQKVYRVWWDTFWKALLMFPLIAAMIATGRVFSAVAISNGGAFNQLIAVTAYTVPLFATVFAAGWAGAAMKGISHAVRERSKGGFASLRESRKKQKDARIKAARTGGLYRTGFGNFSYRSPFKNKETGKRWQKREGSVDKMLNAIGNNTLDAKDMWRVQAARRGGKIGRALFGRQARDLERRIDRQRLEHTANGAKVLQGRYHSARAVGGAFGYYWEGLGKKERNALIQNFGIGKRNSDGSLDEAAWIAGGRKFRGTRNEKEDLMAASILQNGDQGAREAAAELRTSATTLDNMKGAGKEETQRFDRQLWSMMVRAQAGRLEQSEIDDYFNTKSAAGQSEQAYLDIKQIQNLAAPKRTSQAEGYGAEYEFDAQGNMTLANAYADPTSDAAMKSVGRTNTQDIFSGKAEDIKDPDGDLSGFAQALIAASSNTYMKKVPLIDPETGKPKLDKWGKEKTTVVDTGKLKSQEDLLFAQSQRSKLQSGESYAQGDTGLGGQIYRLMQDAGIEPKYGAASRAKEPEIQAAAGYDDEHYVDPDTGRGRGAGEDEVRTRPPEEKKAPPPEEKEAS